MATVDELLKDPDFGKLPVSSRRKAIMAVDPEFGSLPLASQNKVIGFSGSPGLEEEGPGPAKSPLPFGLRRSYDDPMAAERYGQAFGQEPPAGYPHHLEGGQGLEELGGAAGLGLLKPVLTSGTGMLWKTIAQTAKGAVKSTVAGGTAGYLTEKAADAIGLPRSVSRAAGILAGIFGAMSPGMVSEYLAQEKGAVTVGNFLRWANGGRKTPYPAGKGTAPPKPAGGGTPELKTLDLPRKVKPGWKGPAKAVEEKPFKFKPNPKIERQFRRQGATGGTGPEYRLKLPKKPAAEGAPRTAAAETEVEDTAAQHTDLLKQVHAQTREMELPGSPAGKAWHLTPTAKEIYGVEGSKLTTAQLRRITEFVNVNKRPPTKTDVLTGAFKK